MSLPDHDPTEVTRLLSSLRAGSAEAEARLYELVRDHLRRLASARLRNRASGALDDDQTVTKEEIVEHLFYQILNLTQAVFLRVTPNAVSA